MEIAVPWKELCAVADVKLWSRLSMAAVVITWSWSWDGHTVPLSCYSTHTLFDMIQQIPNTLLYVMPIPSSARVSTKLLFTVLAWTFSPTSTSKEDSFFVEWRKFFIFSLLFLFKLLKQISCTILVDILCRLLDKLPLKSPLSNIMPMSFINLSGTDCTYLSIGTSPSKHFSFSNNLVLIAFVGLEKTWLCSSLDHVHAV